MRFVMKALWPGLALLGALHGCAADPAAATLDDDMTPDDMRPATMDQGRLNDEGADLAIQDPAACGKLQTPEGFDPTGQRLVGPWGQLEDPSPLEPMAPEDALASLRKQTMLTISGLFRALEALSYEAPGASLRADLVEALIAFGQLLPENYLARVKVAAPDQRGAAAAIWDEPARFARHQQSFIASVQALREHPGRPTQAHILAMRHECVACHQEFNSGYTIETAQSGGQRLPGPWDDVYGRVIYDHHKPPAWASPDHADHTNPSVRVDLLYQRVTRGGEGAYRALAIILRDRPHPQLEEHRLAYAQALALQAQLLGHVVRAASWSKRPAQLSDDALSARHEALTQAIAQLRQTLLTSCRDDQRAALLMVRHHWVALTPP